MMRRNSTAALQFHIIVDHLRVSEKFTFKLIDLFSLQLCVSASIYYRSVMSVLMQHSSNVFSGLYIQVTLKPLFAGFEKL